MRMRMRVCEACMFVLSNMFIIAIEKSIFSGFCREFFRFPDAERKLRLRNGARSRTRSRTWTSKAGCIGVLGPGGVPLPLGTRPAIIGHVRVGI